MELALTNGIPQYDLTRQLSITVREWTCFPPTISLPADVTDPNSRSILKSQTDTFLVTVDAIDCMKSQQVAYEWTIHDNSGLHRTPTDTAFSDRTSAQLAIPDRLPLNYGVYYARAVVTMVIDEGRFGTGAPAVQTEVNAHFSYDPSPTIAVLADHGINLYLVKNM